MVGPFDPRLKRPRTARKKAGIHLNSTLLPASFPDQSFSSIMPAKGEMEAWRGERLKQALLSEQLFCRLRTSCSQLGESNHTSPHPHFGLALQGRTQMATGALETLRTIPGSS